MLFCIVMDYTDLESKISARKRLRQGSSESERWDLMKQLVEGLRALHVLNILHGDVKPGNIFLCSKGTMKLGEIN